MAQIVKTYFSSVGSPCKLRIFHLARWSHRVVLFSALDNPPPTHSTAKLVLTGPEHYSQLTGSYSRLNQPAGSTGTRSFLECPQFWFILWKFASKIQLWKDFYYIHGNFIGSYFHKYVKRLENGENFLNTQKFPQTAMQQFPEENSCTTDGKIWQHRGTLHEHTTGVKLKLLTKWKYILKQFKNLPSKLTELGNIKTTKFLKLSKRGRDLW